MNGGSPITNSEREDAERAFIRHFLDTSEDNRPIRFNELVAVHGLLDPLVNIDLSPDINVKVSIYYKEECREESISVMQSVKQFKQMLQGYFNITPTNIRLWYYDQEMTKIAGPEEMKFPNKELYTYNVIDGDYFLVDEKAQLRVLDHLELIIQCLDHQAQLATTMVMPESGENHPNPHFHKIQDDAENPLEGQVLA